MIKYTEKEECPKCGANEKEANSPATVYECGSYDYDQRPKTLVQSSKCITMAVDLIKT